MIIRLTRLVKNRSGNAIIEFALGFGLLFPILSGSFQFGYAFYLYNEMQTAVRAGARYASLRSYDSASETPSAAYEAAIANMVVYGDPAGGTDPVVNGLSTSNVTVDVSFALNVPSQVTVGLDNFRANAVFRLIDFSTKPHVAYPYVGRYDPE